MATAARKKVTKAETAFTCPECGKTFTRAAALGAHRKMSHGVAGTSANASRNRRSTSGRGRTSAAATRSRDATTTATNSGAQSIDRDALLRTLFPNGIPPRQDVIKQVNAWLEEADRLARTS